MAFGSSGCSYGKCGSDKGIGGIVATNKGGRKKPESNLHRRRKQWDEMGTDKQRATKRPGSKKK